MANTVDQAQLLRLLASQISPVNRSVLSSLSPRRDCDVVDEIAVQILEQPFEARDVLGFFRAERVQHGFGFAGRVNAPFYPLFGKQLMRAKPAEITPIEPTTDCRPRKFHPRQRPANSRQRPRHLRQRR